MTFATPLSYTESELNKIETRTFKCALTVPIQDLTSYDFSFLFDYKIFPESILNSFGEWLLYDRKMQVGDIIALQAKIPPIPLSVKIVFGVRILSVFKEKDRIGFSYGTLQGHPETGTNEFSFFIEDNALFAQVKTQAHPGLAISRFLAPIFTRPYVNYCNRAALETMKNKFKS
jgi:hypothetical protein